MVEICYNDNNRSETFEGDDIAYSGDYALITFTIEETSDVITRIIPLSYIKSICVEPEPSDL